MPGAAQGGGQRAEPVALGGQDGVFGAGAAQGDAQLLALGGGHLGEPAAQALARRVDADVAAGLRIDERQVGADVGERELTRVADLDGQARVI